MGFADTRWSLVLRAGLDTPEGREALNTLCQQYINPLTAFLIRTGFSRDTAEELLQSFFVKLIENGFIESADRHKGRFRSFLVTALKHSVANDLRNSSTLKRGGRVVLVSLDDPDSFISDEYAGACSPAPDEVFHRNWAIRVLEMSLDAVDEKYRSDGKQIVFDTLQSVLAWDSGTVSYEAAAERLGVSPANVRVLVHRLRRDFRIAVHQQVFDTVADPADVGIEIRELISALST